MRLVKLLCLCSLTVIFLATGCAPVPVKKEAIDRDLEKRREAAQLQLRIAEEAYEKGRFDDAMTLYGNVLKEIPQGEEASLSRLRRGEIFVAREQYDNAIEEMKRIPKRFEKDPIYYDGLYNLALSYSRLGKYDLSERLLRECKKGKIDAGRTAEIEILEGDNKKGTGEYYDSIILYMQALKRKPGENLEVRTRNSVKEIIREHLSIEDLNNLKGRYGSSFPSGYILYALADRYSKEDKTDEAKVLLDTFITGYKGHEYYDRGEELRQRLIEIGLVDRYAVGCILPLTGEYETFGKRALDAIILATGIFDPEGGSPIKLIIEDSKSDPKTTREAAIRLIREERVMGIIGPMGSATALEAAEEAEYMGTPIITLTQKEDITDKGDYIFRNFITSEMQIKTLVGYSVKNLGMKSFAILYPHDNYGIHMMNLFRDEAIKAGGEIKGVESYENNQTDFTKEIKAIAGITYIEKGTPPEKEPQPTIDFDALFIPDSYTRVSMIAPQLAFYNVTNIQLLGTNSWNSSKLLEGDSEFLEGAIFVDGFFLNTFYPKVRNFIDRFYVAFGREPNDLEALAYDAAKIMVDTIKKGNIRIRRDLKEGLSNLKDYPGITGKTSFTKRGDAEKSFYVLMVRGKEIVQIQ
jgi:ABC-type branched-subunit amino acid transport system substrate-binding protein